MQILERYVIVTELVEDDRLDSLKEKSVILTRRGKRGFIKYNGSTNS